MSALADVLRTLHRIHQQLSDLRERKERGPKQVKAHQTNVARLEKELASAREAATKARVTADQKQLHLKSGEGKIGDLQNKLNAASSNREYQALQEQIAADRMAISVLEDEILEALEKIEVQQKAVVDCETALNKARTETAKVEQNLAQQSASFDFDLQRLDAELKVAQEQLPSEFRGDYDRLMAARGSDGMAEVDNNTCGGCFQQIQPNRLNQLFMGQAVFCTACGRLLYLPEDRSVGRK